LTGLIVYPESLALPITLVGVVFVVVALLRLPKRDPHWQRGIALGAAGILLSVVVAAGLAYVVSTSISGLHRKLSLGGAPEFRGVYTAAIGLVAMTVAFGFWATVRRWATIEAAHVGALVVWAVATWYVTVTLPGVSFMLAWPLIAGAIVAVVGGSITLWMATI